MDDISVSFGEVIPYAVQTFLTLIGKDAATKEIQKWFEDLQKAGLEASSKVQMIGMDQPIPIEKMYQPTRLIWLARRLFLEHDGKLSTIDLPTDVITVESLLSYSTDMIILAGPGWGKTTLIQHIFVKYARNPIAKHIPVLFTLRNKDALDDLEKFVSLLHKIEKNLKAQTSLLILLDGYDEVSSIDERKRIASALLKFSATKCGHFILTCRDLFDISDITAPYLRIAPFSEDDQNEFVAVFSKAYGGRKIDPLKMLHELRERGFREFLSHPLLLALTCIIHPETALIKSHNVICLIDRAMQTLSFRWDEGRAIARETKYPLDGKQRIQCLMRIAFHASGPRVPTYVVKSEAQRQLDLFPWENIDPIELLREIARFFGILVPTNGNWEFVHRTLYDYLWALYSVQTGKFDPSKVEVWRTREAYAACLSSDATSVDCRNNWT